MARISLRLFKTLVSAVPLPWIVMAAVVVIFQQVLVMRTLRWKGCLIPGWPVTRVTSHEKEYDVRWNEKL